jgi:hypothetical protein
VDKRRNILELIDELKVLEIESKFNKKARSRWLKTSMRHHIEDDFVFIDTDTIIAEDLSSLDNMDINMGAVLNEHTYLSVLKNNNPVYFDEIQELDKRLGFTSTINTNTYFNSGFLYCRDHSICHDFFYKWHQLWNQCYEHGSVTDQQSYNQTNYILGNVITELGGEWNNQILADGGIRFLHNAKIIHYFAGMEDENPYLLASQRILENIKKTGNIDQQIKDMLVNPKIHFASNSRLRVIDKKTNNFKKSVTYAIAKLIYDSKPGAAIDYMFYKLYKNMIKPMRKKLSK